MKKKFLNAAQAVCVCVSVQHAVHITVLAGTCDMYCTNIRLYRYKTYLVQIVANNINTVCVTHTMNVTT